MAKKDMDLYHSWLTQDDFNELIIRYKIPRDLHPRLPSEEFVMSDLPDDAISVYHCIFDFFGVWIPFSSFILALIKHYKHWKSGFFLIDRRAILDYMSWRHSDSTTNDLMPPTSSFSMEDSQTCDLVLKGADGNVIGSGHCVTIGSTLSIGCKQQLVNVLRKSMDVFRWECSEGTSVPRLPFYYTPPAAIDAAISNPTPDDLAVGNPSAKVVAKAKASQNRKASTSRATSSHVAKHTRDISGDAIHRDFFPFSPRPYYATYLKGSVAGNSRLSTALNQATILEAEKDEEILRLVQGELFSLEANVGFEHGLSMHRTHEEFVEVLKKTSRFMPGAQDMLAEASSLDSTMTHVCSSLELLSNTIPSYSATLLKPNEEWVNAMVDGSDHGMTGDAGNGISRSVFVQDASHVVDGNAEFTLVGSECVSSSLNDVVVSLSA
nr:hypothetical protein [Tanacetum cinerariifolium]